MGRFGTQKKGKISVKRKGSTVDKQRASFNKMARIRQPAKEYRGSHHQVPRSPQRRSRIEAAEELVPAEEVVVSQILSHVAEPLSSASLVTEEVMPLELRSAKNNNKKRKNFGKNSPTFILKDD